MDLDAVGAVGHSAGGGTVLTAANDPAIDGYVSMASGVPGGDDAPTLPAKPSFFLAGSLDAVVPPERTQAAFDVAPAPTLLWIIEGVGHNGFDDFCTFGDGQGIIGVAIASGLGALLEESQPALKALGEDGCVPPAVPVDDTFPMINHAVTSWLHQPVPGSTASRWVWVPRWPTPTRCPSRSRYGTDRLFDPAVNPCGSATGSQ